MAIRLTSNNSFGLDVGTQLLYKGIAVGSIIQVGLVDGVGSGSDKHEVFMDALIDNEYAHLIKSHNRFFVTGSATAELTESGLSVTVPPAKQLLTGSISFVSEGKSEARTDYQLFQSKSLAEIAKFNQSGSKTLSLFASELPSISKGSPLYRNLQVGSISDFQLADGGVRIKVTIENRYTHLLNKHTVFGTVQALRLMRRYRVSALKQHQLKLLFKAVLLLTLCRESTTNLAMCGSFTKIRNPLENLAARLLSPLLAIKKSAKAWRSNIKVSRLVRLLW